MAKQKKRHPKREAREEELKNSIPEAAFDEAMMGWYAPEYIRYHRGPKWYLVAGILNLLFLLYAWFVAESWTMVLVFIVLPLVVFLELKKKPDLVPVIISPFGIRYGKLRFAYSNLKGFWVLHDPPYEDELHLKTSSRMYPELVIPLARVDVTLLRNYLVTQIPEIEGQRKSLVEMLIRLLKLT